MPACDDCGARVCLIPARDVIAFVEPEMRSDVRQNLRTFGPKAYGKVCHECRYVELCELFDD